MTDSVTIICRHFFICKLNRVLFIVNINKNVHIKIITILGRLKINTELKIKNTRLSCILSTLLEGCIQIKNMHNTDVKVIEVNTCVVTSFISISLIYMGSRTSNILL